jgi:hypothetical protein
MSCLSTIVYIVPNCNRLFFPADHSCLACWPAIPIPVTLAQASSIRHQGSEAGATYLLTRCRKVFLVCAELDGFCSTTESYCNDSSTKLKLTSFHRTLIDVHARSYVPTSMKSTSDDKLLSPVEPEPFCHPRAGKFYI